MPLAGNWKRELPVLILMLIPFLTLPFLWDRLPDVVPIPWDLNGEPDRLAGKTTGRPGRPGEDCGAGQPALRRRQSSRYSMQVSALLTSA